MPHCNIQDLINAFQLVEKTSYGVIYIIHFAISNRSWKIILNKLDVITMQDMIFMIASQQVQEHGRGICYSAYRFSCR